MSELKKNNLREITLVSQEQINEPNDFIRDLKNFRLEDLEKLSEFQKMNLAIFAMAVGTLFLMLAPGILFIEYVFNLTVSAISRLLNITKNKESK